LNSSKKCDIYQVILENGSNSKYDQRYGVITRFDYDAGVIG
jgi:hypothetical protein